LVAHQVVNENLTGSADWLQTLQPEPLSFISYPYEWCFDMLKEAALTTLEVAAEAMEYGMMLKDASAYNLQWHQGRMVFIDSLSFEKYDAQKPWIAYRQFCEHFFAPLALMHYLKEPLQPLLIAYPDGIPLPLAKKLLPFRSRLNLHTYLHLHFHGAASAKAAAKKKQEGSFSKQKMKNLLRSLEEAIRSFSLSRSGVWSRYYEEAAQRDTYLEEKKQIISDWMTALEFSSAMDAGGNEGLFSELMAERADRIISADLDHHAVNELYKRLKKNKIENICPLVIDLSHPSPAIGVNNEERASFLERSRSDLVLALALLHHLAIGKNISFGHLAKMFHSVSKFLIIEFVPKEDEKIGFMLTQKKDVYQWYNRENFLSAFSKYFTILKTGEMSSSKRLLYLMQRHED
jgi:ribosomal protein L11 methylase PrmA